MIMIMIMNINDRRDNTEKTVYKSKWNDEKNLKTKVLSMWSKNVFISFFVFK